jgi:hypothetical protein
MGGNYMNEEPYRPTENDMRYDALWERDKDTLVHNVMELEDSIELHQKEWDKIERENRALTRKLEHKLMQDRPYMTRDWDAIYSPQYYFDRYGDCTREDLILEIMNLRITLRGMFHD